MRRARNQSRGTRETEKNIQVYTHCSLQCQNYAVEGGKERGTERTHVVEGEGAMILFHQTHHHEALNSWSV